MSAHIPNASVTEFDWFKSSYSSGNQNCLEVASAPGVVPVRDSKDPDGPALLFTPGEWSEFIAGIKVGNLNF